MNYINWALLGMPGYSATILFVKFAISNGKFSSFLIFLFAVCIVFISVIFITAYRGYFKNIQANDLLSINAFWSSATGIVLTIAVAS